MAQAPGELPPAGRPARLSVEIAGRSFTISLTGRAFSIGRDPQSSLALNEPGIEEHHALIQWNGGRFELFDLCSNSGVLVNGKRIEAAALKHGDRIRIGDVVLWFLHEEPAPKPPAPESVATPKSPLPVTAPAAAKPVVQAGPKTGPVAKPGTSSAPSAPAAQPASSAATTVAPPPRRAASHRHLKFTDLVLEDESLHTIIQRERKRAPYTLVSFVLHALPFVVMLLLPKSSPRIVPKEQKDDEPTYVTLAIPADPAGAPVPTPPREDLPNLDIAMKEAAQPEPVLDKAPAIEDAGGRGTSMLEPGSGLADDPGRASAGVIGVGDSPFGTSITGNGRGDGLGDFSSLGGGRGLGTGGLQAYARGLRATGLDIVFIIDSTGSMGPSIGNAKKKINDMIAVLGALVPKFRLGFVTYRDVGDEYVVRSTPLTSSQWQAVDFLDHLGAAGGGDPPEAVDEGLRTALTRMEWTKTGKKIAILVGDAPPHPENVPKAASLVAAFGREKGTMHAAFCGHEGTREEHTARDLFRSYASSTGGVLVDLGAGQDLIGKITPLVFGKEFEDEMKKAVQEVQSGFRTKAFGKIVAQGDGLEIRKELKNARPTQGYLLNALARDPRIDHLGAFLDVLADKDVGIDVRWAALVMAKRLLREAGAPEALLKTADDLSPALAAGALASKLRTVRDGARKFGVPAAILDLPAAPEPPRPAATESPR